MAAIIRLWWRRLVNAYEIKAGMVCLQCNNCVIHTWALQRRASHNGALYKSIFLPSDTRFALTVSFCFWQIMAASYVNGGGAVIESTDINGDTLQVSLQAKAWGCFRCLPINSSKRRHTRSVLSLDGPSRQLSDGRLFQHPTQLTADSTNSKEYS